MEGKLSPDSNADSVPDLPGVYIIYDAAGPINAARSGTSVRQRLLAHRSGNGNGVIGEAILDEYQACSLTFTFAVMAKCEQRDAEALLNIGIRMTL